jgi:hypothetical protein
MKRVIAYIDGFNLYFGLREKGWKGFYWLNLRQVALNLLKSYQKLVAVKYFTSVVTAPPSGSSMLSAKAHTLGPERMPWRVPAFRIWTARSLLRWKVPQETSMGSLPCT